MKVAAIILSAACVPGLFAQAPIERRPPSNQPIETLHVETRLVNIALNVVDDKGSPVGGLQRDDFTISEDGKPQKIAIFEREATSPLSIVLAIDASESVLRNEALEKSAAKHFVNALLREQDELDLMDFSDTVREIVSFTNKPKRIEAGLGEIQHGDATALYDAIYLASQRLESTNPANGRRRIIVLITDGTDTVKGSHYEQAIEQAQRAGAMVYSIIIVPVYADAGRNTGGEHALIQMAEDTGGKYYYVEDPKDLEPAFRHVSDDLRTQYLLGYYAPQRGHGDSFRRIQVKMKDPALQQKFDLRYRTGYYADSQ
ncbi:VWA domain-containing protein [Granulicella arctica]|uniref:Ca-activated chloride channel family protein n=1 Tax=Granulicella arctica TaxID=940613 RepID=A0A7Y9PIH8_9BACT|nr:VWA domain-containing protein [Granulicella arctica]NYF79761.1 Ca-activated chloride channel family protein [Granulicella arctica]